MAPIVVAVDFSDASRRALEAAVQLARQRNAPLVVVHAFEELPRVPAAGMSLGASKESLAEAQQRSSAEEARKLSEQWAQPLRDEGMDVSVDLGEGPAKDLVCQVAASRGAQMIVVGSHGRRGFKRLVLGSVAQDILHQATVPVLVVPAR